LTSFCFYVEKLDLDENWLMSSREIAVAFSENHKNCTNSVFEKNAILIILNAVVHEVTTKLAGIKILEQVKFPMKKAPKLRGLNNL